MENEIDFQEFKDTINWDSMTKSLEKAEKSITHAGVWHNIPSRSDINTEVTNDILRGQSKHFDALKVELELSNEKLEESNKKIEALESQLQLSNLQVNELQKHLGKEREERLADAETGRKESLKDRTIAIISIVVALLTWFFK